MSADENRKRIQELRRIGFQNLLAGVVILFAVGVLCYIVVDEIADSQSHSGGSSVHGRGMGFLLLIPAYGLWCIVRGVIYLIRAQSGNERYAKGVEDAMNKYESKLDERMGQKVGKGSMDNLLVLLGWVFLVLVVIALLGVLYVSFSHYEGIKLIHQ